MNRADFIIEGDYVVPVDADAVEDGAVAVSGGKIVHVGGREEVHGLYEAGRVLGGRGRTVMPGFVNTHSHAAMVYMRGMADDLPLKDWLEEHIWPAEAQWLDDGFVYDGAELACLEMALAGVTTFNDMYFYENSVGRAAKRIGLRAVIGSGVVDFPTKVAENLDGYLENARILADSWRGDELIRTAIAPHTLYTCGPETWVRVAEFAEKHDLIIHTHLSETSWEVQEVSRLYGKTPGMLLEDIGVLGPRIIAAHCVWLTDEEIALLAERGVAVAHCVESNLKLASGMAPVARMLSAGMRVGLGTDGAASNNDLDMMSEMSTAAKLQKAVTGDPTVLEARTVLEMATLGGARCLGMDGYTGSLTPGKAADIIILDMDKPHLTPVYNIYSHLVYALRSSDVESVMVGGRLVVEAGKLVNADEHAILERAREWGRKIAGRG